jgi:DNA-binding transcriptional regulator YiaG
MEKPATELLLDESKSDRRGRRITSVARIEELLRAYDESGLTQAAFARREGVKYATFAHWVQARRARGEAPPVHTGANPSSSVGKLG